MSADPHSHATEDAHTGPIKNPKQLLVTVFFAFIAPIVIIVGLVSYVVSGLQPSSAATGSDMSLYGVTPEARQREVADRLKKVGFVEVRDAKPAADRRRGSVQDPVRGLPWRPRHSRCPAPGRCRRLGPAHRPRLCHAARACAQGQGRNAAPGRRRLRRHRNRSCRGLHGQRWWRQVPRATARGRGRRRSAGRWCRSAGSRRDTGGGCTGRCCGACSARQVRPTRPSSKPALRRLFCIESG